MKNEDLQEILRRFNFEEKTFTSLTQPPLACRIGGIDADTWVKIAAAIEEKASNEAFDELKAAHLTLLKALEEEHERRVKEICLNRALGSKLLELQAKLGELENGQAK
jgi:hypothetical protein